MLPHCRTAEEILAGYDGAMPFPFHLKEYLRRQRKFGSRDRKHISLLCYQALRTGAALAGKPAMERILAGQLLCSGDDDGMLAQLRPEWAAAVQAPLQGKEAAIRTLHPGFRLQDVFPCNGRISTAIDIPAFIASHLRQPDLFLRIRPGREEEMLRMLQEAGIPFRRVDGHGLALDNATHLDLPALPDREYVVQDLSSQRCAAYLPDRDALPPNPAVWDACAGSGGKSLLVHDTFPGCRFWVTDSRASILHNLSARFREAGIRGYRSAVADLSTAPASAAMPDGGFDLVVADVPCTGSGTWSRAPWELCGFDGTSIERQVARQRAILANILPKVRRGGYLLYVTCSVFPEENEGNAAFIEEIGGLHPVRRGYLSGFGEAADTLYCALFTSKA